MSTRRRREQCTTYRQQQEVQCQCQGVRDFRQPRPQSNDVHILQSWVRNQERLHARHRAHEPINLGIRVLARHREERGCLHLAVRTRVAGTAHRIWHAEDEGLKAVATKHLHAADVVSELVGQLLHLARCQEATQLWRCPRLCGECGGHAWRVHSQQPQEDEVLHCQVSLGVGAVPLPVAQPLRFRGEQQVVR